MENVKQQPLNHHGSVLRTFLSNHSVSVQECARLMEKSRPAIYALLEKERFNKEELAIVCLLFGLSPADFILPPNYFVTKWNPQGILHKTRQNSVAVFKSWKAPEESSKDYREFVGDYFNSLTKYSLKALENLRCYIYLGKIPKTIDIHIREAYFNFYTAVEEHIKKTENLRYERFLTLPINMADFTRDRNETLRLILERIPDMMFLHIARCFKQLNGRFTLFVLNSPYRLFSYQLIDKAYCISEYDKHSLTGNVTFDTMFINAADPNEPSDPMHDLIQGYHDELNAIVDRDRMQMQINTPESNKNRRSVSKEKIELFLFELKSSLDTQISEREQEINYIEEKRKNDSTEQPQEGLKELYKIRNERDNAQMKREELEKLLLIWNWVMGGEKEENRPEFIVKI